MHNADDKAELEADVKIDPNALDVAAIEQADLFFKWAERAIAARAAEERAELALKVLEAQLQLEAREHPDRFNLKNTTETAIKSAVIGCARYAAAHTAYFRVREAAGRADAAVKAMDMRKRALEALINLHGQQYFAGPTGSARNLGEVWQRHQARQGEAADGRVGAKARKRANRED